MPCGRACFPCFFSSLLFLPCHKRGPFFLVQRKQSSSTAFSNRVFSQLSFFFISLKVWGLHQERKFRQSRQSRLLSHFIEELGAVFKASSVSVHMLSFISISARIITTRLPKPIYQGVLVDHPIFRSSFYQLSGDCQSLSPSTPYTVAPRHFVLRSWLTFPSFVIKLIIPGIFVFAFYPFFRRHVCTCV